VEVVDGLIVGDRRPRKRRGLSMTKRSFEGVDEVSHADLIARTGTDATAVHLRLSSTGCRTVTAVKAAAWGVGFLQIPYWLT
jgi:hypothetical protein